MLKVLSSSSPSWGYTTLANGVLNFPPIGLAAGANVKTLILDGGQYQLWGSLPAGPYGVNVGCNTDTVMVCGFPTCDCGDGTSLTYNQSGRPFWLNTGDPGDGDVPCPTCSGQGFAWWTVTSTSIGGLNWVYSQVRALPSGYFPSRIFPFRWNSSNGTRYLFSATNDDNICTNFLYSSFLAMYVVRTAVQNL